MYENRIRLSTRMVLSLFFGHPTALIGIIMFAASVPFLTIFIDEDTFNEFKFKEGNVLECPGEITGISGTNATVNDQPVTRVHFQYSPPESGKLIMRDCYSTRLLVQNSGECTVEYIRSEPEIGRVKGMEVSMFGAGVLFILIMPIIASAFLIRTLFKGFKQIGIIRNGGLAYGKLIEKLPTMTTINKRRVYKYKFEFTVDHTTYECICKTHKTSNLEDEAEEPIIYDRRDPSKAVMMDGVSRLIRKNLMAQLEQQTSYGYQRH